MFVQWQQFYNAPTLSLWIVLGLLLVVPRHNRHRQAWLILILPLAVAGFWQVLSLAVDLHEDAPGLETLPYFSLSLAIAWTSVWLVGPWLCRGGRIGTTLLALIVMFVVGAVANFGYCGWSLCSSDALAFGGVLYVAVVVPTALSGFGCRRGFRSSSFLLWLALWIPVVCTIGSLGVVGIMMLCLGQLTDVGDIARFLFSMMFGGMVMAVFLYILNLPVALLCIFSSFYRERLFAMFGPMEPEPWDTLPPLSPFADRDTMEGLSQP